eukprot:1563907-Prymnesium_polylepis.1
MAESSDAQWRSEHPFGHAETWVPGLVGFEIHHSYVLRLFVDVLSEVVDAHHHHKYTGYEYSA